MHVSISGSMHGQRPYHSSWQAEKAKRAAARAKKQTIELQKKQKHAKAALQAKTNKMEKESKVGKAFLPQLHTRSLTL